MRHYANLQTVGDVTPPVPLAAKSSSAGVIAGFGSAPELSKAPVVHDLRHSAALPRLAQTATTDDLFAIERIMNMRQRRADHFGCELFADPAWDMLLGLARAEIEQRRTTISDLCMIASVPTTTAIRWIAAMTAQGLMVRTPDPLDRRRIYIELSLPASLSMKSYLEHIGF